MPINIEIASNSSAATVESIIRRRTRWSFVGIITSILVIVSIVIPTTVILTKTHKTTTMTSTIQTQTISSTTTKSKIIDNATIIETFADPCNRTHYSIVTNVTTWGVFNMIVTDIDNDNRSDIIIASMDSSKLQIYYNDDKGYFILQSLHPLTTYSVQLVSIVDINDD